MEERVHTIETHSPEEVDRFIRFFIDDRKSNGERINFIQANFNQHVMVQRPRDLPYEIYSHGHPTVLEIIEGLEDITGLVFPREFFRGTSIYNVPGILMDKGMVVNHRVLRQQIFLGAQTSPIPQVETWHSLFNALGNAVWNFLDHKIWRDRTEKTEIKNEYREIRGISQEHLPRRRDYKTKHQQNLFFIASEDFRYLFGSALAGRGDWFLQDGEVSVPPPLEEVADFWRRELNRYDEIYSRSEWNSPQQEETPPTESTSEFPLALPVSAGDIPIVEDGAR